MEFVSDVVIRFKDFQKWEEYNQEYNKDRDAQTVISYAEQWMRLMQPELEKGNPIENIAENLSQEADTFGITGYQYGLAVRIISDVWVYGEELRLWNNFDVQIGNEGERANINGGVLNPALLVVASQDLCARGANHG